MKIGTRSSTMAIAQTDQVAKAIGQLAPSLNVSLVRFKPRGDIDQTSKLAPHGGKGGAFVAEIRDAIRNQDLQAAMHSLKDMPGDEQTPGLTIGAVLPRDNIEDVLVLRQDHTARDISADGLAGLKIGTNSVRRAAQLRIAFPKSEIIHYRGAVDTRLIKLDTKKMQKLPGGSTIGPADALVVARSGLERLNLSHRISHIFHVDDFPPAIGQGVVAVECAIEDWKTREILAKIDHQPTRTCIEAEREMLWILNGHCNSPIAGWATLINGILHLRGMVLSEDGMEVIEASSDGDSTRPRELGRMIGLQLLEKGASRLIEAARLD